MSEKEKMYSAVSCLTVGLLAVVALAVQDKRIPNFRCPVQPMCSEEGSGNWWTCQRLTRFGDGRRPHASVQDHAATEADLRSALSHIFGQGLSTEKIIRDVMWKQEHPNEPLILHLAGDNGAGKTKVAQLISTVLSLRCGLEGCHVGDNMLEVGCSAMGNSFDDLPDSNTADKIRIDDRIAEEIALQAANHAKQHPYGIFVLNDLTAMSGEAVRRLMPLFGRGRFIQHPNFDPAKLLVIVTTDFATESRTRGLSYDEIQLYARKQFRNFLDPKADSFVLTIPFVPVSQEAAAQIVAHELLVLPCTHKSSSPAVAEVTYDDDVVLFIVEEARDTLALENGRGVWKAAATTLAGLLRSSFNSTKEKRVKLHFTLGKSGVAVSVVPDSPSRDL